MKEILDQGKDGQRFIEDLISFIRDVLLYQNRHSWSTSWDLDLRKPIFSS